MEQIKEIRDLCHRILGNQVIILRHLSATPRSAPLSSVSMSSPSSNIQTIIKQGQRGSPAKQKSVLNTNAMAKAPLRELQNASTQKQMVSINKIALASSDSKSSFNSNIQTIIKHGKRGRPAKQKSESNTNVMAKATSQKLQSASTQKQLKCDICDQFISIDYKSLCKHVWGHIVKKWTDDGNDSDDAYSFVCTEVGCEFRSNSKQEANFHKTEGHKVLDAREEFEEPFASALEQCFDKTRLDDKLRSLVVKYRNEF